jgi:hypothetical protein
MAIPFHLTFAIDRHARRRTAVRTLLPAARRTGVPVTLHSIAACAENPSIPPQSYACRSATDMTGFPFPLTFFRQAGRPAAARRPPSAGGLSGPGYRRPPVRRRARYRDGVTRAIFLNWRMNDSGFWYPRCSDIHSTVRSVPSNIRLARPSITAAL